MFGQTFQHRKVIGVAPVPALDGAAGQTQCRKRHHPRRVEEIHRAQAVAGRAGAHRRIEREQAWLEFGDRVAAHRTGELGIEQVLFLQHGRAVHGGRSVQLDRQRTTVGQPERGLETFSQALAQLRPCGRIGFAAHLDPVDHHINVVFFGFLEFGQVVEFVRDTVHPKTHIPLCLQLGEQLDKLALALTRHRRQHHQARVLGQRHHRIHHLAHGLGLQRQVMVRAIRRTGTREQQPQVVVDLGHRAHGRTRVVAGSLLFDRNRRAQTLDHVHIGLVHQLQKLPRIGGQTLHIAALALGIQGIEGQAGFTRSAQAGDHHQLVARNVQVDVLEVVGTRAADADPLGMQ